MAIVAPSDIKPKTIIKLGEDFWVVTKMPDHVKPGKGGAFFQVSMENIRTGARVIERFRASDVVEVVPLMNRHCTFLYCKDKMAYFMDQETFEEIPLSEEFIKDKMPFLSESMAVVIGFCEEMPIDIMLPNTVVLEITETDPVIKNATASPSYKHAILSNGVRTKVPPYITVGEKVVIKTEDGSYVERAK